MGDECRGRDGKDRIYKMEKKEQWLENCLYIGGRKEGDRR